MDDSINRQAAIDAIVNTVSEIGLHDNSEVARYGATFRQHEIIDIIEGLPSAQPEPEIYWGYPPTCERPLADVEIVSRLRDIQKQIPGGSYAIDRAIEIIEAVAERRTDQPEIIHCRECKYHDKGSNESDSWNLCGYRPWQYVITDNEHYCGYAKRRIDG